MDAYVDRLVDDQDTQQTPYYLGRVEVAAAGDGKIVFTKTIKVNLGSGITPLFSEPFDTKAVKGTYTVKAEITADENIRPHLRRPTLYNIKTSMRLP